MPAQARSARLVDAWEAVLRVSAVAPEHVSNQAASVSMAPRHQALAQLS